MHRQPSSFSETEGVTDSEAVSESTTELSDGAEPTEFEPRCREARGGFRPSQATEKIATVCHEIKQRFQSDLTNTDDENVI